MILVKIGYTTDHYSTRNQDTWPPSHSSSVLATWDSSISPVKKRVMSTIPAAIAAESAESFQWNGIKNHDIFWIRGVQCLLGNVFCWTCYKYSPKPFGSDWKPGINKPNPCDVCYLCINLKTSPIREGHNKIPPWPPALPWALRGRALLPAAGPSAASERRSQNQSNSSASGRDPGNTKEPTNKQTHKQTNQPTNQPTNRILQCLWQRMNKYGYAMICIYIYIYVYIYIYMYVWNHPQPTKPGSRQPNSVQRTNQMGTSPNKMPLELQLVVAVHEGLNRSFTNPC